MRQRPTRLNDFFQYRKQVFHAADFLVVNQDVRVFQLGGHVFAVGHEVWRQIPAIKLHTFNGIQVGFGTFGFFNSDYTVFANFFP